MFFKPLLLIHSTGLLLYATPWKHFQGGNWTLVWNELSCEHPFNIYLFKVNNSNTRERCELCSKLTIKTPERRRHRLLFLLLTLNIFYTLFKSLFRWIWTSKMLAGQLQPRSFQPCYHLFRHNWVFVNNWFLLFSKLVLWKH